MNGLLLFANFVSKSSKLANISITDKSITNIKLEVIDVNVCEYNRYQNILFYKSKKAREPP